MHCCRLNKSVRRRVYTPKIQSKAKEPNIYHYTLQYEDRKTVHFLMVARFFLWTLVRRSTPLSLPVSSTIPMPVLVSMLALLLVR